MIVFRHEPVMVAEVLEFLVPGAGRVMVDCTLGGGGHAEALLSGVGPGGGTIDRLIGIDRDPEALAAARERLSRFGERAVVERGVFDELPGILDGLGIEKADGVLMDLGASYHQLTRAERGMSFMADGPLDMRMDPEAGESAAEFVAGRSERELADVIRGFGEERHAKRIARALKAHPPSTTAELRALVEKAAPSPGRSRIHPATRTFMALRIAVNRELERLEQAMENLPGVLGEGGRAVVTSYHSGEDRIVKEAIAREVRGCACPPGLPVCACGGRPRLRALTKKPVRPSQEEVTGNPAARSAKLRACERLSEDERQ